MPHPFTPPSPNKFTRNRLPALIIACALLALSGCQGMSEDLAGLASSFTLPSPGEAARMMFNQDDPDQRRRGTMLLASSPFGGSEPYVKQFRDMAQNEKDPLVLATALRALGRHGEASDATYIAPNLTHEVFQVRWEAAQALQRLHHPPVIPAMLDVLRDDSEHPDVRVAIAEALGQYPEDRVFQGLVRAMDVRELAINLTAEQSLKTLTGRDFGQDPRSWLQWYQQETAAANAPFAGGRDYLYPTYTRRVTFLEKLAFWSPKHFESPAPPIGLHPASSTRTYSDSEADNSE